MNPKSYRDRFYMRKSFFDRAATAECDTAFSKDFKLPEASGWATAPSNAEAMCYDFVFDRAMMKALGRYQDPVTGPDGDIENHTDHEIWRLYYFRIPLNTNVSFDTGPRSIQFFLDGVYTPDVADQTIAFYIAKRSHEQRHGMVRYLDANKTLGSSKATTPMMKLPVLRFRHLMYHSLIGSITIKHEGVGQGTFVSRILHLNAWPGDDEIQYMFQTRNLILSAHGFIFSPVNPDRLMRMSLKNPTVMVFEPQEDTSFNATRSWQVQMYENEILQIRSYDHADAVMHLIQVKITRDAEFHDLISQVSTKIRRGQKFENLSMNVVDAYRRCRHDYFQSEICNAIGATLAGDISLRRMFSTPDKPLDTDLTPDLVIAQGKGVMSDKAYNDFMYYYRKTSMNKDAEGLLVDFFVSDKSMIRHIDKTRKYAEAAKLVSEQTGKKFYSYSIGVTLLFRAVHGKSNLSPAAQKEADSAMQHLCNCHSESFLNNREYDKYAELLDGDGSKCVSLEEMDRYFGVNKSANLTKVFNTGDIEFGGEDPMKDAIHNDVTDYSSYTDSIEVIRKRCEDIINKGPQAVVDMMDNSNKQSFINFKTASDEVRQELEDLGRERTGKVNDVFKFPPLLTYENQANIAAFEVIAAKKFESVHTTDDGTHFIKEKAERYPNVRNPNMAGYGIDYGTVASVEELIEFFKAVSHRNPVGYDEYNELIKYDDPNCADIQNLLNQAQETNVFQTLYMLQKFAQDVLKLCGRRNNPNFAKGRVKSYSVLRSNEKYCLMIAGGPNISAKSIIKVKLFYRFPANDLRADFLKPGAFHSLNKVGTSDVYETRYLAIASTDLEVWCRAYDKGVGLFVNALSHRMSANSELPTLDGVLDESTVAMYVVMMEHKRHTSSCLQNFRYLVQSAMSIVSDRYGLVKKIFKQPIRTPVQMYIMAKMLAWCSTMAEEGLSCLDDTMRMMSGATRTTDYDCYFARSLFTGKKVEFAVLMDEMYYSNLFNKDHGQKDHRVKDIMEKTAEDEKTFEKNREAGRTELIGEVPDKAAFIHKEKDYGMYCKDFVSHCTKMIAAEFMSDLSATVVIRKMTERLDQIAKMKSSVQEVPFAAKHCKMSLKEKRAKLYDTQRFIIEHMGAFTTLEVVNFFPYREIYMGMFPKSQIGGPREIFIQDMISRSIFKLVESVAQVLCRKMPQEMIVRGDDKYLKQSNNFSVVEERASTSKKTMKMKFSANKDSSHWSPAWNCLLFAHVFKSLDFPPIMTALFTEFFCAMMSKRIGMPPELKEKWMKKPSEQLETDPNLEWMRRRAMPKGGFMRYSSGFCQGALHFMSSFVHCIHNAIATRIFTEAAAKMGVEVYMESLISSDDSTDCVLLAGETKEALTRSVFLYSEVWRMTYRLFNIHENLKKSGISVCLSEFNSCFILGKRVLRPDIKDVFNATALPDMTYPEDSVREHISNERRLLDAGCSVPVMKIVRALNRAFNIDAYMVRGSLQTFAQKLGLKDDKLLPYTLGFLPGHMLIESLIFGPDVYLTDAVENKTLGEFYRRVMCSEAATLDRSFRKAMAFENELVGRLAVYLDTKLTTKLDKFRRMYIDSVDATVAETDKFYGARLDMPLTLEELKARMNSFVLGQSRKDEFGETAAMHSFIRASSFAGRKLLSREVTAKDITAVIPNRLADDGDKKTMFLTVEEMISVVLAKPAPHALTIFPHYRMLLQVKSGAKAIQDVLSTSNFEVGRRVHLKMRRMCFAAAPEQNFSSMREFAKVMDRQNIKTSTAENEKIKNFEAFFQSSCEGPFVSAVYELIGETPRRFQTAELTMNSLFRLSSNKDHIMASEKSSGTTWEENVKNLYLSRSKLGGVFREVDEADMADPTSTTQRLAIAGTIIKYESASPELAMLINRHRLLKEVPSWPITAGSNVHKTNLQYLLTWAQHWPYPERLSFKYLFRKTTMRPVFSKVFDRAKTTFVSLMPDSSLTLEVFPQVKRYRISHHSYDPENFVEERRAHYLHLKRELVKLPGFVGSRDAPPSSERKGSLIKTIVETWREETFTVLLYQLDRFVRAEKFSMAVTHYDNKWELGMTYEPLFMDSRKERLFARIAKFDLADAEIKGSDYPDKEPDSVEERFVKKMMVEGMTEDEVLAEMEKSVRSSFVDMKDLRKLTPALEPAKMVLRAQGVQGLLARVRHLEKTTENTNFRIIENFAEAMAVGSTTFNIAGEMMKFVSAVRPAADEDAELGTFGFEEEENTDTSQLALLGTSEAALSARDRVKAMDKAREKELRLRAKATDASLYPERADFDTSSDDDSDSDTAKADQSDVRIILPPDTVSDNTGSVVWHMVSAVVEYNVDWRVNPIDFIQLSSRRRDRLKDRFMKIVEKQFDISVSDISTFVDKLKAPAKYGIVDIRGNPVVPISETDTIYQFLIMQLLWELKDLQIETKMNKTVMLFLFLHALSKMDMVMGPPTSLRFVACPGKIVMNKLIKDNRQVVAASREMLFDF